MKKKTGAGNFNLQDFKKSNPGFILAEHDLSDSSKIRLKGKPVDAETLSHLKAYQRLLRIHPDEQTADRLMAKGINSAWHITSMSKAEFVSKQTDCFEGDQQLAATAYDNASNIRRHVMLHWAAVKDAVASPYYKNARFGNTGDAITALYRDIPGYQDLFGSLEYCSSRACQTLYSPGAYLVEMLQLIDKHITGNPKSNIPTALQFNTRRPDIEDQLLLNCANTDDEIPYLEIVNEIMQRRVQPVGEQGDEWLSLAKYPFNLPFHYPLAQIGQYFNQYKTNLADLYRTMNVPSLQISREILGLSPGQLTLFTTKETDKDKLGEYYGLTLLDTYTIAVTGTVNATSNSSVITGTGTLFLTELKAGYLINLRGESVIRTILSIETDLSLTVTTPVEKDITAAVCLGYSDAQLNLAADFSRQTGLTTTQLRQLIYQNLDQSEIERDIQSNFFINLSDTRFPSAALASSELSADVEYEMILNLSYDKLDAINRFVRLSDALNWAYEDLDWVLRSFNIKAIDDAAMQSIAKAYAIHQSTGLNLDVVCSFWSNMKTIGKKSSKEPADLYDRVFNRTVIIAAGSPVLYPDNPTNIIWDIYGTDETNYILRNRMMSSLLLNDNDLTEIAKRVCDANNKIPFTLEKLSQLYRVSTMIPLTGLSAREFAVLLDLLKITVPENVEQFESISYWSSFIQKTGFTADELLYIVKDTSSAYLPVYYTDNAITALLLDARDIITPSLLTPDSFASSNITNTESTAAFKLLVTNKYVSVSGVLLPAYTPEATLAFLFSGDKDADKKREQVRAILNASLQDQHTVQQALLQKLAVFFNTQLAIIDPLVTFSRKIVDLLAIIDEVIAFKTDDPVPADIASFLAFLNRNLVFIRKLNLTEEEVTDIVNSPAHYNISDPLDITPDDLDNIVQFVQVSTSVGDRNDRLIGFFKMPDTPFDDKIKTLSAITHWDEGQIKALVTYFWKNNSNDYASAKGLFKLNQCFSMASKLGVNSQFLVNAAQAAKDPTQLTWSYYTGLAKSMLDTFVAKNAGPGYAEIASPLNAKLIEARRNALLPYTIWYLQSQMPDIPMQSMTDLYNYFLVDPEMGADTSISRIRLASLSVQLYVQRCHQDLEEGAVVDDEFRNWWAWARQYRTWEANRKVFLYPENYLEPELRKTKTTLFETLESSLDQSNLSKDSITSIFNTYLDGISDLSNMVIAGNFMHSPSVGNRVLYLIGRSNTSPYDYYFNSCSLSYVDETKPWTIAWESWKKIEIVISSPYATPVFANDRLYLFWVETRSAESTTVIDGTESKAKTTYYADIKYSYCNFNGRWIVPQQFGSTITLPDGITAEDFAEIYWQKVYIVYNTKTPTTLKDSPFLDPESDKPLFFITYGDFDYNTGTYDSKLPGTLLWPDGHSEDWKFVFKGKNSFYNGFPGYVGGLYKELQIIKADHVIFDNDFGDASNYEDQSKVHPNPPEVIETLLKQVSRKNAAVQTVKNQPGWIIFNNGDESFVFVDQKDWNTIADNLEYDFANDSMEFLSKGFDASTKPTFSIQRISTAVVTALSQSLLKGSIDELLTIQNQQTPELQFSRYNPDESIIINKPATQLDFNGSFGIYFKEIFFYIPFLIAQRLSTNKQYEEAKKWYEYIFDPIVEGSSTDSNRFWNYLPFRSDNEPETFSKMLQNPKAIACYQNDPFDPFAIADLRTNAYQKAIVMKYINNLVEWGDYLFTQDTWETINEATMLYKLAEDMLGPKPVITRDCPDQPSKTYQQIKTYYADRGQEIPVFLIELEHVVSSSVRVLRTTPSTNDDFNWYFHVPENTVFMDCWNKVEDRLFKIRHSLNIEGVARKLSLYGNPIDVFSLIKAAATNRDISSVIAGLASVVPAYRFNYMLEIARNYVSMVNQLGSSLQAAIEQRDGDQLQLIRLRQETSLLQMSKQLKNDQLAMAQEALVALKASYDAAQKRYEFYDGLITKDNLPNENAQLDTIEEAKNWNITGTALSSASSFAYGIPQIGSPFAMTFGGQQIGAILREAGAVFNLLAVLAMYDNSLSFTKALFERRKEDWVFQKDLASFDKSQINSQIRSAQIMVRMNQREIDLNDENIKQNQEVENFMKQKFAGGDLFQWLVRQISGVYFQSYQLALDLCRSAEKALQFEMDTQQNFVGTAYWDSLRNGLTAAEKLSFDLQRMQQYYITNNTRRLEIQKSVSLLQLNPLAMLSLVTTGACEFGLSELLFDYDFPGHYCRKISGVSISIPAVVGPYQNIKATLTQLSNKTLLQPNLGGVKFLLDMDTTIPEDTVLRTDWRPRQQIALSSGLNDSGMFQLSFNDERYLPFEGTGAVSTWRLTMPKAANRFDFASISDVIINLQYTAHSAGEVFAREVTSLAPLKTYSSNVLINLGVEFSGAWYSFMHPTTGVTSQQLLFTIRNGNFPPNMKEYRIRSITLQLNISEDLYDSASGKWDFGGTLTLKLKIAGATTSLPFLFTDKNYSPVNSGIPAAFAGKWEISAEPGDIPSKLKDPVTGWLDPKQVEGCALVIDYTASLDWGM